METAYDGRQIVGMDLHRRRSVLVRMTEDGRRLGTARITNSPAELRAQIARAGQSPKVVLEATYGWYWAADTLAAAGADGLLAADRGYQVIQQLPGIGPVLAAVIIAEIGDVTRFKNAGQLCSWAGLTPRHRGSDTKVARGHVTKQGSRMLRWALIEAIQRVPAHTVTGAARTAIIARRGKEARSIAKVAAARRLLILVYYGMRDGQIRCLSQPREDPPATQTARAA